MWTKIIMVTGNHSLILNYMIGRVTVFKGNLTKNDLAKFIHVSDAFTTEILKIWSEIGYKDKITSIENLLSLPLWQNSLVRIGDKPIYYKSWSSKGIQKVRHLTFTEFKKCFNVKTNFLVYDGVGLCINLLRNGIENQNEKKKKKREISALF